MLVLDIDDVVQRGDHRRARRRDALAAAAGPGLGRAGPGRHAAAGRARRRRRSRSHPGGASPWSGWRPLLLFLITAFSPNELIQHLTVFALAVVVGFYVIGHVHHALHTPLMSVTNAISGIIVVGALLQIGHDDAVVTVLAFVAILLASINVFGGFAVTRRMLGMFTRGPRPMTAASAAVRGLHRRRRCCSSSAWPDCRKHETAKAGNAYGIAGMAIALAATIGLATRSISAAGLALMAVAVVVGAVDRPVAGPAGRDDRHARADRDAAQLRRPRRGAGRLERLPLGRGRRRHPDRGRRQPARHPLRRGRHRRLHRRGHLHRLDRGLPQAVGPDQVQPADAARRTTGSTWARWSPSPSSPCCS